MSETRVELAVAVTTTDQRVGVREWVRYDVERHLRLVGYDVDVVVTNPLVDEEHGVVLDPCEHPSTSGNVCDGCGAVLL